MADFEAGTLRATITKLVILPGGVTDMVVVNSTADGQVVSEVIIKVPASALIPMVHQRIGDTDVLPAQGFLDSIAAVLAGGDAALAALIAAGKHTP